MLHVLTIGADGNDIKAELTTTLCGGDLALYGSGKIESTLPAELALCFTGLVNDHHEHDQQRNAYHLVNNAKHLLENIIVT